MGATNSLSVLGLMQHTRQAGSLGPTTREAGRSCLTWGCWCDCGGAQAPPGMRVSMGECAQCSVGGGNSHTVWGLVRPSAGGKTQPQHNAGRMSMLSRPDLESLCFAWVSRVQDAVWWQER